MYGLLAFDQAYYLIGVLQKLVVVGTGRKLSIKGLTPNDMLHSPLIPFAFSVFVYSKLIFLFEDGSFYLVYEVQCNLLGYNVC